MAIALTESSQKRCQIEMTGSCEYSLTDGESSRHPDGNLGLPNRNRSAQRDRQARTLQYSITLADTCWPP